MYSIGELAVARQHNLPVTWLIIDDGGYRILREYMTQAFGAATATELARPNFIALAAAFSVQEVETMGVPDRIMIMLPMHRLHRNPREHVRCSARRTGRGPSLA